MKTSEEMVKSLLARRDAYDARRRQQKKTAMRIATATCAFVLVAAVGVGLWQGGRMTPPTVADPQEGNKVTQETTPPTMPSYPILWGDEEYAAYQEPTDDIDMDHASDAANTSCYRKYLKKCGKQLYDFLSNNETTEKIAMFVRSYNYESTLFEFQYNGRTVAEYQQDVEDHKTRLGKLQRLVDGEGEDLAIGKDAYLSQSDYKDMYNWLGKELVDKYVVDGVFLAEKAKEDLTALKNDRTTAQVAYDEACRAYQRYAAAQLKPILEQKGFDCYYTEGDEYLLFFANEDEFVTLTLGAEEFPNWKYDWATEPMPMQAVGYLDREFVYKGKTVKEYSAQLNYYYYDLDSKYYNLILEDGELLEMGRDRYLTKDPNGNPWPDICGEPFTKQTYDNYVKYYGDMLTKYIVDGKFLKEKAQADWDALKKKIEETNNLYEEACDASEKHTATQIKEKLEQMGYECTYTEDGKSVIFHITNQAYVTLPLDVNKGGYFKWVKLNEDGTIYVDPNEEIHAGDFCVND